MPSHISRAAITTEALVAVSLALMIVSISGLMLTGVYRPFARRHSNQYRCGSNLKQIVTAMVAYSIDYNGSFPYFAGPGRELDVDGRRGLNITLTSLEMLAAIGTMPNAVFYCHALHGPHTAPSANLASMPPSGAVWAGTGTFGYTYDWTLPNECASYRIVLSDRTNAHRGKVTAAAYDSSIRSLWGKVAISVSIGPTTADVDPGIAVTNTNDSVGNSFMLESKLPDMTPDNIFDSVGDNPKALDANGNRDRGEGDARRSWVK